VIPDVPTVLTGIVRSAMMDLTSETDSPYRQFTLQMMSALLMMISQEFDRAAARLIDENDALVALFRDAQSAVRDDALRAALRDAVAAPSPPVLVSALRERNRPLRDLLIRLHVHVETLDGPAARALDERIWAELAASTRRRHMDLANG